MSLTDWSEKFKSSLASRHLAVILITILTLTLGFGLGRLSTKNEVGESPLTITSPGLTAATQGSTKTQNSKVEPLKPLNLNTGDGKFVASRNGTKYYLPWCGGVSRIKPENLIGFASAEEARARGYTPAANCPGLE